MWTRLVRPRVAATFRCVESGDTATILRGVGPRVEHRFAGDHPLGGTRTGPERLGEWFDRLHRLFPTIRFDLGEVAVSGPPWDLRVVVEWRADVTPAAGPAYVNSGAHVIRLRRGRAVSIHAYEDSQAVARACRLMAEVGIEEAAAPAITGGA